MENDEEKYGEFIEFAHEQLAKGLSERKVVNNLVDKGLDRYLAEFIVYNARNYVQFHKKLSSRLDQEPFSKKDNSHAYSDIFYGFLWLAAGGAITYFTYEHANNGGVYIVAYGAIIGGMFQIVKGIVNLYN